MDEDWPDGFTTLGWKATERWQCPFDPGTAEWKVWQQQFLHSQASRDDERGRAEALERAEAVGLTLHEPISHGFYAHNALGDRKPLTADQQKVDDLMYELEHGLEPLTPRTDTFDIPSWSLNQKWTAQIQGVGAYSIQHRPVRAALPSFNVRPWGTPQNLDPVQVRQALAALQAQGYASIGIAAYGALGAAVAAKWRAFGFEPITIEPALNPPPPFAGLSARTLTASLREWLHIVDPAVRGLHELSLVEPAPTPTLARNVWAAVQDHIIDWCHHGASKALCRKCSQGRKT